MGFWGRGSGHEVGPFRHLDSDVAVLARAIGLQCRTDRVVVRCGNSPIARFILRRADSGHQILTDRHAVSIDLLDDALPLAATGVELDHEIAVMFTHGADSIRGYSRKGQCTRTASG